LGSCVLKRPEAARIVQDTLLHFEGVRYHLLAWCVMSNHVHVVVTPKDDHKLCDILHSWKSFTAQKINKLSGKKGPLWERESFNHLVRKAEHVDAFAEYTNENPVDAGFVKRPQDWAFSSAGHGAGGFQPVPMEFVDPRTSPFIEPRSRGELPHLHKPGGTYFITWRLLDAVILDPG